MRRSGQLASCDTLESICGSTSLAEWDGMERGALAVAAEVVGVPVEAVEVEVAADLAVFSDPVLAVVVDLVPPRVRAVLLPELDGVGEVLLVVVVVVVLDLVGAVVIPSQFSAARARALRSRAGRTGRGRADGMLTTL